MKLRHLLNEGRNTKAVAHFKRQMSNIKYLYFSQLDGLVQEAIGHYGFKLDDSLIDALKEAIEDIWFDGVEPEWETEESWLWWEKLNASYFQSTGEFKVEKRPGRMSFN